MIKVKSVLETLYICFMLVFFSKELINNESSKWKSDFDKSGVVI